jgi:hypothetical protein
MMFSYTLKICTLYGCDRDVAQLLARRPTGYHKVHVQFESWDDTHAAGKLLADPRRFGILRASQNSAVKNIHS